jgi:xanthine dehydrogenase accessory factor
MTDGEAELRTAAAWLDAGDRVALATVVRTWGSSPRPAGSQLVVSASGAIEGSVSGGCVEGAVVREARAAMVDGRPRLLRYGVTDERAWEVGLPCGGAIEVLVHGADRGVLAEALAAIDARRPAVLGIDVATGASRLAAVDDPVLGEGVRDALAADRSGPVEAGGATTVLRVLAPAPRVVVVGAGHLAQPLVAMARLAGFEPTVVDPRAAFATPARFPGVPLVPEWPEAALPALGLDARTAVVVLAHDAKIDDPALAVALRSDAFYVGALGSRRTHAARLARLRALGFADDALARIHGPVGLAIGAVRAGEIATSIVAELVQTLRTGR